MKDNRQLQAPRVKHIRIKVAPQSKPDPWEPEQAQKDAQLLEKDADILHLTEELAKFEASDPNIKF